MKTRILLFISIVLITFLACSKQGEPPKPEEPPTVDDYYILVDNGTDTFHLRTSEKAFSYSVLKGGTFSEYRYGMWLSTPDSILTASVEMIFHSTLKMDQIDKSSILFFIVVSVEGSFREYVQGNLDIDELTAVDSIKVWKQYEKDTMFVDGLRIRGHGELGTLSNRDGLIVMRKVNASVSLPFPSFVNLPE